MADTNGNDHRFYFATEIDGGAVQLRVTPTGLSGDAGLDASRVYPVVNAVDDGSEEAALTVSVWLDRTTLSPNDDGRCS